MYRQGDRVRVREDARSLHPPPGTVGTIWGTSVADGNPIVDCDGIGRLTIPPGDLTIVLPPRAPARPTTPTAREEPQRRKVGRPRKGDAGDDPIMVRDGNTTRPLGIISNAAAQVAATRAPARAPTRWAIDDAEPDGIVLAPAIRSCGAGDDTTEGGTHLATMDQTTRVEPWRPTREPYLLAGHAAPELHTSPNNLAAMAQALDIHPEKMGHTHAYTIPQLARLHELKAVMDELGVPAAIAKKAVEWRKSHHGV